MTAFDIVAGLILLISMGVGLFRGAVRELVALFAFALAAGAAVYLLPISAPLAHQSVHQGWAAKAVAMVIVFLVVYVGLRLAGGALSAVLHRQATLGTLDRSAGLGLGLVRGLVVLGGFYLVFNLATPADLAPQWITGSPFYSLSRMSGRTLAAFAPTGLKGIGGVSRALTTRVGADGADHKTDSTPPAQAESNPYELRGQPILRRRMLRVQTDATQAQ